jgi:predicted Zn-dependent peptidase
LGRLTFRAALLLALAAASFLTAGAADSRSSGFHDLESRVTEFSLPNGVTFLVLERHDAPVFYFRTYVDAGGVDEVAGVTGIAHMFEHMAFKGTPTVGTTDPEAEKKALDRVDAAWEAYAVEMRKGADADSARLGELEQAFQKAQEEARGFVVSNEFSKVLEEQGAVDINAFTMMDATQYHYGLPSNRLELWARMEGDRLTQPVLREFYTERSVVQEERRFQESSPMGRAYSTFWMSSFLAHPYGNGLIGYPSDLQQITREDAQAFFDRYYVGPNITVAVVGDVSFDQVKRLAETYFSGIRAGEDPPPVRTVEPPHTAEIRTTIEEDAQPAVLVGFHIPGAGDPDWPVYDLLGDILGSGRTSRVYDRLVKREKVAVQAGGTAGFPGYKYPNLLILQAIVARNATTDAVETALFDELERFAKEGPSPEELQKGKTRARASFIRMIRSDEGLAGQLAGHEEMQGDWRKLFRYLERLDAVTVEEVRAAAAEVLRPQNRTVTVLRRPGANGQGQS